MRGRKACMAGGVHGRGCAWQGGACMVGVMHSRGACVAGGVHGWGHVWQRGSMHGGGHARQRGVCMAGGMHGRGHVCHAHPPPPPPPTQAYTMRYGQWVGGTHPTWLCSCCIFCDSENYLSGLNLAMRPIFVGLLASYASIMPLPCASVLLITVTKRRDSLFWFRILFKCWSHH